jgi:hypothetical protein
MRPAMLRAHSRAVMIRLSRGHTAGEVHRAGSTVRFADTGGSVRVTVLSRVRAPRWLLLPLPSVTLRGMATVPAEGPIGRENDGG